MSNDYNKLNLQEQQVILNKGTEAPFSGEFWDNHQDGIYSCKQCNNELFSSEDKFDSRTGWPSFDDTINNNVKEIPDVDGRRVEIVCIDCGGHLGHVFKGEKMTPKSVRHCVNSISLNFSKTI
jgi:methionine-R-sulfoxide reductase